MRSWPAAGAWRVSERALAGELIADFGPGMLVIADRGFYGWQLWQAAAASGADLLWRMQDGPSLPVVRAFPDGSYESFLLDPKVRGRRATQRHRGSANIEEPSGIPVRVIEYEVTNREGKDEIFCLITTIMDPEDATAAELAAAYQERWEFESSLDEIKTHQRGRGGVLRSKSPEMIRQEIWAFLLTHYVIRHLMCEAADQAGKIRTDCLSCDLFVSSAVRLPTRRDFPPCRLANALAATSAEILERLNPPRRNRSSPRAIKRVHVHAYRRKRSGDTTTQYLTPPHIHILAVA